MMKKMCFGIALLVTGWLMVLDAEAYGSRRRYPTWCTSAYRLTSQELKGGPCCRGTCALKQEIKIEDPLYFPCFREGYCYRHQAYNPHTLRTPYKYLPARYRRNYEVEFPADRKRYESRCARVGKRNRYSKCNGRPTSRFQVY